MDGWLDFLTRPEGIGTTSVVILVGAMMALGWLVPRGVVDRIVERLVAAHTRIEDIQEKRLTESAARESEWRAAWTASQEANIVQARQLTELIEISRTSEAMIRALAEAARRGSA